MTLRDKFLLAFLALALVLTGMFILFASRISSMLPEMSASQTERYEARLKIRDMRAAVTDAMLPNSLASMNVHADAFRTEMARYQQELSLTASPGAYQSLVFENKHSLLDGEEETLHRMEEAWLDFQSAYQNEDSDAATSAFRVLVTETEALERINSDATSALRSSAAVTRRYLITFSMIAVAILLLGILVMAQFLIAWISRPLEKIQHAAERIAEGDFSVELASDSRDELGILTRSFDDMRRKVLKLNELRDGFISTASHQLRTPLTAIRWLMESLRKSVREGRIQLLQKDAQAIEQAYDRTLAMSELVSSLLSMSRLDAEKIKATMVSVPLDDILSHVRSSLKEACDRKHVELRVSSDIIQAVRTDPLLVTEILTNLVGNAVKYSKPDSTVSLYVTEADGHARIEVHDHGIGIEPDDQKNIFTKFFRSAKARNFTPDGTGIGLALVKSFADLIDATVSFTSDHQRGTSFFLSLPLSHDR